MHHDAARDLALVVRFLPDLVPRSPALLRVASYTAGPSASAMGGRPDRLDAGRGFGHAIRAWEALRRLVRAGSAEDVAVLWSAYAALDVRVDDHGVAEKGPAHRARQAEAIATGAAPAHVRRGWRLAAAERRRVAAYVCEQEVVVGTVTRAITHPQPRRTHQGARSRSTSTPAARAARAHFARVERVRQHQQVHGIAREQPIRRGIPSPGERRPERASRS